MHVPSYEWSYHEKASIKSLSIPNGIKQWHLMPLYHPVTDFSFQNIRHFSLGDYDTTNILVSHKINLHVNKSHNLAKAWEYPWKSYNQYPTIFKVVFELT